MDNHALLSASSSHRWLNCPPSARLCEGYDDKGSDFAAEGTGDCVIITDGTLHIVDYKHGRGVLVEADDNPQMKLFDCIYDIDTVSMTIYQPRRSNVSTFTIPKKELYEWARSGSGSNRKYTDENAVIAAVTAVGYDLASLKETV